jgi:NitT/TauT family transport system permease protein
VTLQDQGTDPVTAGVRGAPALRTRGRKVTREAIAAVLLPMASLGSLLLLWVLFYDSTRFLPAPSRVIDEAPEFLSDSETWSHVYVSLRRLFLGLGAGVAIGVAVATLMRANDRLRHLLSVYVGISLRVPSTIAAIMALVAFKRAEFGYPAVIAFITFPFVTVGLADGLASADRKLDDMARLYRLGPVARFRHVLAPFAAPFIFGALRNAHALAWKVIVVVEIFGAAEQGIGSEFNFAFRSFLLVDLMLWLLLFMVVLLALDYGALRMVERFVGRWRPVQRK